MLKFAEPRSGFCKPKKAYELNGHFKMRQQISIGLVRTFLRSTRVGSRRLTRPVGHHRLKGPSALLRLKILGLRSFKNFRVIRRMLIGEWV